MLMSIIVATDRVNQRDFGVTSKFNSNTTNIFTDEICNLPPIDIDTNLILRSRNDNIKRI